MGLPCCCTEYLYTEKRKKYLEKENRLHCILCFFFISTVLYVRRHIFFFPEHDIFHYNFSGIHLHLDLLLSLIPWMSKVLVAASRMLPVQEAWQVLVLPWLNRKTLVASKHDSWPCLKIVLGLQAEQHWPFASWWAKGAQMHKMCTACQTSMGTWEFHKMESVWNENRQCCCPDESPPEQLCFLMLFPQKSDSYDVFPILLKYNSHYSHS